MDLAGLKFYRIPDCDVVKILHNPPTPTSETIAYRPRCKQTRPKPDMIQRQEEYFAILHQLPQALARMLPHQAPGHDQGRRLYFHCLIEMFPEPQ